MKKLIYLLLLTFPLQNFTYEENSLVTAIINCLTQCLCISQKTAHRTQQNSSPIPQKPNENDSDSDDDSGLWIGRNRKKNNSKK